LHGAKSTVSDGVRNFSEAVSRKRMVLIPLSATLVGIIGGAVAWKAQGNEFGSAQRLVDIAVSSFSKLDWKQLKAIKFPSISGSLHNVPATLR